VAKACRQTIASYARSARTPTAITSIVPIAARCWIGRHSQRHAHPRLELVRRRRGAQSTLRRRDANERNILGRADRVQRLLHALHMDYRRARVSRGQAIARTQASYAGKAAAPGLQMNAASMPRDDDAWLAVHSPRGAMAIEGSHDGVAQGRPTSREDRTNRRSVYRRREIDAR